MNFLYGELLTGIPTEFVPPEVWPEFGAVAGPPPICSREEVGEHPRGIRWGVWPLTFEYYVSDDEPDLEQSKYGRLARNRVVTWQRIRGSNVPTGWKESKQNPSRVDGYRDLSRDITSGWNKNGLRELSLWQSNHEDKTHCIESVDFQTYKDAYMGSLVAKRVDANRLHILERKLGLPYCSPHIELWGVRNMETGAIVAGTAVIHSPTHKGSTHFAPFIREEARHIYAASALIHHWFVTAKSRGDAFAVSTDFWFPGKPEGWRGFSLFKSHFGWQYVAYPPELARFVRGKLF